MQNIHHDTLKTEIDRLVKLGVLKRAHNSQHAYPTFIIPKSDKTVRFILDFRKLNEKLELENSPLLSINNIMKNLKGFQFAIALDLNMGYCTIWPMLHAQELHTIITLWGRYSYQRLSMGMSPASDIFQMKMMQLMHGLEDFVRTYLNDIVLIGRGTFKDHLVQLEHFLKRLHTAGLKINARKNKLFATELEYLGFWLTCKGIQPIPDKIIAIYNIAPPKTIKKLRRLNKVKLGWWISTKICDRNDHTFLTH